MHNLRAVAILSAVFLVPVVTACSKASGGQSQQTIPTETSPKRVLVAAQGRLEGRARNAAVGSELDGVVSEVLVEEGDEVEAGQPLARIRCADLRALAAGAEARLEAAQARLRLLLRGARDEERKAAIAGRDAAEQRLARANQYASRQRTLWRDAQGVIDRDSLDKAEAEAQVASALAEATRWRAAGVLAPPLPEEESLKRAEVGASQAEWRASLARLEQCTVRSPITGTVVRRQVEPGTAVSAALATSLFEIADLSSWHARIEVDEADLAQVHVGQRILASAAAFAGRSVPGEVIRLSPRMGRRSVLSADPSERADRSVREVVARLDEPPPATAIGLRVIVRFLEDQAAGS